jgi:hypothetical protein
MEHGQTGLPNIGKTCYLNAVIQGIFPIHYARGLHLDKITPHSTRQDPDWENNADPAYKAILNYIANRQHSSTTIQTYITRLLQHLNDTRGTRIVLHQQQSPTLILAALLDLTNTSPASCRRNLSIRTTTCTACGEVEGTSKFVDTVQITLQGNNQNSISLEDCITQGAKTQKSTVNHNCRSCKVQTNSPTYQTYEIMGPYTIITIQGKNSDPQTNIKIIPTLTGMTFESETDTKHTYSLRSVISTKKTDQAQTNHSTTITKWKQKWYHIDDSTTTQIEISEVGSLINGIEHTFIYEIDNSAPQRTYPPIKPHEPNIQQGPTNLIHQPQEEQEQQPQNTQTWPPLPTLIKQAMNKSAKHNLQKVETGRKDLIPPNTDTICQSYNEATYSRMNSDTPRNDSYTTAINNSQINNTQIHMDIGCGANALLTTQILKRHKSCIAIEINQKAAHTANRNIREMLTADMTYQIINETAASTTVIKAIIAEGKPTIKAFHEIFGYLASSEGIVKLTQDLRNKLPTKITLEMIPAHMATFCTPIELNIEDKHLLIGCKFPNPQTILIAPGKLNLKLCSLTKTHHILEQFDLNNLTSPLQSQTSTLTIDKKGTLNALGCYIVIDFGPEYAGRRFTNQSKIPRLDHTETKPRGPSTNSLAGDPNCGKNWHNMVLTLQNTHKAKPGDQVTISSTSDSTHTPTYTFQITHRREEKTISTEQINLCFSDLYPTYDTIARPPNQNKEEDHPSINILKMNYINEKTTTQGTLSGARTRGQSKQGKKKGPKTPPICDQNELRTLNNNTTQNAQINNILRVIEGQMEREKGESSKQTLFCPKTEKTCRALLHLYATINTHPLKTIPGEKWQTTTPLFTNLGATHDTISNFAQNRTTWINLTENNHEQPREIVEITQAITTSKQARAAGLFYMETSEMEAIQTSCNQNKIRFCKLFTFKTGTISLETLDPNRISTESKTKGTNLKNIQLLLWETIDMNPFDPQTLELELKKTLNIETPETLTQNIRLPWTYTSKNTTRSEIRRSPFTFPSFPFLHKSPSLLPNNNYSTLEAHNQLAATMGILPQNLRKALKYHGHEWDQDITESPKKITELISNNLLQTTTTIYQNYLRWYRMEKFGDYG